MSLLWWWPIHHWRGGARAHWTELRAMVKQVLEAMQEAAHTRGQRWFQSVAQRQHVWWAMRWVEWGALTVQDSHQWTDRVRTWQVVTGERRRLKAGRSSGRISGLAQSRSWPIVWTSRSESGTDQWAEEWTQGATTDESKGQTNSLVGRLRHSHQKD